MMLMRSRVPQTILCMLTMAGGMLAVVSGRQTLCAQPPIPAAVPIADTITYDLTPLLAQSPLLLHIEMTFDAPVQNGKPASVLLQMPVWSPGDYQLQNFAQYVRHVRAYDALVARDRRELPVTHPDPNTWRIDPGQIGRITVAYDLPAMPPGNFSENVQLKPTQVFVNGASALLYLVGQKDAPAVLTAHVPRGWRAEMPLPPAPATEIGVSANMPRTTPTSLPTYSEGTTFRFAAPDYDTLADSPLVMGTASSLVTIVIPTPGLEKTPTLERTEKNEQNIPAVYRAVYFGDVANLTDSNLYTPMLTRIIQTETQLMGGPSGPRYTFFFDVNGAGGGLEHLNSARIALFSRASPARVATMVAHEFFHQWNVKRIRPRVLGPFDYIHPPRTRNLWFAEGITDYYAQVAACRAGLRSSEQFLNHWKSAIAAMQRNPARLTVSADAASWNVWEGNGSDGAGGLSYYDKGALIGLCLDLKIRHVTQNRRSLDDVMRALYKENAPPHPGYEEDDLRIVINQVAGADLTAFYNLLARSTAEMPFSECLGYAGLDPTAAPLPAPTADQLALRRQWIAGRSAP